MSKLSQFEEYVSKICQNLKIFQDNFRKEYGIDNYVNWHYNQSSQILKLYSRDKEIYFMYIPVGTFSQNSKTWLWSWANENSLETNKFETLKIKDFGDKNNYTNLTNGYFEGDEYTGWELTSIAFDLIGGIGTYRVISGHLEIYFLLTQQITKSEVDQIENKLIECDSHGKIRRAFICQHLNTESKTGFEEAFKTYPGIELQEDDDLQAWCSTCEKERLKTNGWNDVSMEFANIKLVCERCYFQIKDFNLK